MQVGDAFYPITPVIMEHLWIVVTAPASGNGKIVMVNVTSHRAGSDEACVLQDGDHPFIQHQSTIAYQHAQIADAAALDMFVAKGYLQMRARVTGGLLHRIQNGALASTFTPRGVQTLIRRELGMD